MMNDLNFKNNGKKSQIKNNNCKNNIYKHNYHIIKNRKLACWQINFLI